MQAVLVMFRSDGERRSFSVTRDVTVIGRRDDCDLRIPLGDVSRKHARLIRDGDAIRLEDLGSSNGTYLNGQRIERDAVLQAGDSIQVGPVVFVLQVDGHPADEELQPVTADGGEAGGFGDAALGAGLGAAGGAAVGAAALGLDDDELSAAPAGEEGGYAEPGYAEGGEFDPLGELPAAAEGETPTLELGHVGDEGMDPLEHGEGFELGEGTSVGRVGDAGDDAGGVPIGQDPLALADEPTAAGGEDPLAVGGDDLLAVGEDPLAHAAGPAIPLAGDAQPIGLADDDDFQPIPLAGGEAGTGAHGGPGEGGIEDTGLELTDEPQPAEGDHDAGLDDLLIDIAPEPPKNR